MAEAARGARAERRSKEAARADDSTHDGGPPPGPRADEPAFPVAGWDRYAGVRFLGRGGMGMVFLALDRALRRPVAIKFVRGDDPEHVRRLIAEARAQARVRHPRVCEVHEVGEVGGRVYIAMQYIEGAPLGELASELTTEEKALLVRGAAEGIHEAHRVGIIHRDLKPANIMVARGPRGLEPFVLDFGLARAVHEPGATATGALLGTPCYMAPEQARGHPAGLDRRADVYSLGATLYHLVGGEPPVSGDSPLEVVHNLLTEEPRPLRSLDRDVPADLAAIIHKCLERDRSARYDSARALADDLGRFLDGAPVSARAAGRWYRARKRIARHRRMVALLGLVGLLLAAATVWGAQGRRGAARRVAFARQFTEKVEHIEAMARYSALSPAHDIRADREAIRARMAALGAEVRQAGPDARGPGRYALGRGHLALGELVRAQVELEEAWRLGFREPRVAYALALVMGGLYRDGLISARRIERPDLREAREREIERRYRDPALGYLADSAGAEAPSAEYAAALLAFYQGRLDPALRHLDAVAGQLPWFHEAHQLRGDIRLARGLELRNRGDRARALVELEAGRAAYAAALAIGESVPAIHASLGELEYTALVMELYGKGDVAPAFDRVTAAAAHALSIEPDHHASLVLRARAHRSLAEHEARRGRPVDALLARAITDARRAAAAEPDRPEARLELARIYRQQGEVLQGQSLDPAGPLRSAIEVSRGIAERDRDAAYHGNLGLVFKIWADYQDQVGLDARDNRDQAIAAYRRALELDPRMNDVWINLAISYLARASLPRAPDPGRDLERAAGALDRALAMNPRHVVSHFYRGEVHRAMARRARAGGVDPAADLVRALEAYAAGLAVNPRLPHLHNGIGAVHLEQAREARGRGQEPEPLIARAEAAFQQAVAAAPEQAFGHDNVGCALIARARIRWARGEDPTADVRAAVAAVERALKRIPDQPAFWSDLGAAHAIQAAHELERGRDPEASLARAEAAVARALAGNPEDSVAQLRRAETLALRARLAASRGRGRTEELAAAASAFERAIALAPDDDEPLVPLGHLMLAWATVERAAGRDPAAALARGRDLADRALTLRPGSPDARVLRAHLSLVEATWASDPAERRERATRSAEDFDRALAADGRLANRWRRSAATARALAADAR